MELNQAVHEGVKAITTRGADMAEPEQTSWQRENRFLIPELCRGICGQFHLPRAVRILRRPAYR